jgi:hypothetical protein
MILTEIAGLLDTKKMSNAYPIIKPGGTQVLARCWSEQVVHKYLVLF